MGHSIAGHRWPDLWIPMVAALPVALIIAVIKPSLSLPLLIGTCVLVVTFLSPLIGLYVLVFSMLLGPEFMVGGMGSGTSLGRGVTLRFDDFLLVLVGLGWLGRLAISEGVTHLVKTPLNRPIVYYTAACAFATLMGILFGRVSFFGGFFFLLKYYEYFFLYFMTVNIVTTKKQVRHLIMASLLTCLLVSLYALWQIPTGARVSAPFEGQDGEPNTLGGYLVFIMSILTGLLFTPGAIRRRWAVLGLLGMCAIALQATLSRASFLAAGMVLVGVLELARRRSPALLAALLVGLLAGPFVMPGSVKDRILYTFAQPQEEGQIQVGRFRVDTSTSERLRSWQHAVEGFWRTPLWGMGVTGGPFMDAMYPRVLMETGVLGMGAFLYLMWTLYRSTLGIYRRSQDPFLKGLCLGFLLGFLGLLVHAIGANTFIIVRIMEPFWLYAALLVRSDMIESQNVDVEAQSQMEEDRDMPPPSDVDPAPVPPPGRWPGIDSPRLPAR